MKNVYAEIKTILENMNISFQEFGHRPVYTSKEASEVSEHLDEECTKCIVLQSLEKIFVVTIAANEKINFSEIKKMLSEKKLSMMPVEHLKEKLGVEIGAVSPFGYESTVGLVVSSSLLKQNNIYFNPGLNNVTLKVKGKDFENVMMHFNFISYTIS